jgi:hypothetical protein
VGKCRIMHVMWQRDVAEGRRGGERGVCVCQGFVQVSGFDCHAFIYSNFSLSHSYLFLSEFWCQT